MTPFVDERMRGASFSPGKDGKGNWNTVLTTSSWSENSTDAPRSHGFMSLKQLIAHSSPVPPVQKHHSECILTVKDRNITQRNVGRGSGDDWATQLDIYSPGTFAFQSNEERKSKGNLALTPKICEREKRNEIKEFRRHHMPQRSPEEHCQNYEIGGKAIQKEDLLNFTKSIEKIVDKETEPTSFDLEKYRLEIQPSNLKGTTRWSDSQMMPLGSSVPEEMLFQNSESLFRSLEESSERLNFNITGPVVVGHSISVDDWVPDRPPKNSIWRTISRRSPSPPHLLEYTPKVEPKMYGYHCERLPTPELPPPPPQTIHEDAPSLSDEPLPPPPPNIERHFPDKSFISPHMSLQASHFSSNYSFKQDSLDEVNINKHTVSRSKKYANSNEDFSSIDIEYDQDALNAIMESNGLSSEVHRRKCHPRCREHQISDKPKSTLRGQTLFPMSYVSHFMESTKRSDFKDTQWRKMEKPKYGNRKCNSCFHRIDENASHFRNPKVDENCATPVNVKWMRNERKNKSSSRYSSRTSLSHDPSVCKTNCCNLVKLHRTSSVKAVDSRCKFESCDTNECLVSSVSYYLPRKLLCGQNSSSILDGEFFDFTGTYNRAEDEIFRRFKQPTIGAQKHTGGASLSYERDYQMLGTPVRGTISGTELRKEPLEIAEMKGKSTENWVLDNRLPLDPPDLIPKTDNLKGFYSVREPCKKLECYGFGVKGFCLPSDRENKALPDRNILCIQYFDCNNAVRTVTEHNEKQCCDQRTFPDSVNATLTNTANLEFRPNSVTETDDDSKGEAHGTNQASGNLENFGVYFAVAKIDLNETPESGRSVTLHRVPSTKEEKIIVHPISNPGSDSNYTEYSPSKKLKERSRSLEKTDPNNPIRAPEGQYLIHPTCDWISEMPDMEKECKAESESRVTQTGTTYSKGDTLKLQCQSFSASKLKLSNDHITDCDANKVSKSPKNGADIMVSSKNANTLDEVLDIRNLAVSCNSSCINNSESNDRVLRAFANDGNYSFSLSNSKQLNKKKEELIKRLDKKLDVLREEQSVLSEECAANEQLGINVASSVVRIAASHEVTIYRLHVEEIGKITSLLLCLSRRLAKVENTLTELQSNPDQEDVEILIKKRDKLLEQMEEAKQLKNSIDRRSESVSKILQQRLNSEEFADYMHFIKMKAKLIADSQEISEKISLGEEQLAALRETSI